MTAPDLVVVRSRRVAVPEGIRAADVHVRDGRIAAVTPPGAVPAHATLLDAGDAAVFPGLVDVHVHVNEPGRTEWEGFASATQSAAAGGVTAIVDMPLNSVPATTTPAGLREKTAAAAGQCFVDVGLWGGVVPGNSGHLEALLDGGVLGFKCFLVASGVDEFPHVGEADLRAAMPILARRGAVLLAHAERPGPIDAARPAPGSDRRRHAHWLASRPRAAENEAVALLLGLCRETRCRVHVVHLSSSDALPELDRARAEGLPVTVETCPHYLTFCAEEIPDGATEYKCAPPIRERENRETLWRALREGRIDFVATDHSPCPPAMKRADTGDFFAAWGGIASLQLLLPAVWTEARARGAGLADLAPWLCRGPARLAGLAGRKGEIAPGCDADFVVWDPEAEFVVEPQHLRHRHKITPYAGRRLAGVVQTTLVRGQRVYDRGGFPAGPMGEWLRR